jgi:hypothetical protein
MADHTTPDAETQKEEAREARMKADAGHGPTEEEEQAAESNEPASPSVARAEEESRKIGAATKGEGRIS